MTLSSLIKLLEDTREIYGDLPLIEEDGFDFSHVEVFRAKENSSMPKGSLYAVLVTGASNLVDVVAP